MTKQAVLKSIGFFLAIVTALSFFVDMNIYGCQRQSLILTGALIMALAEISELRERFNVKLDPKYKWLRVGAAVIAAALFISSFF